MICRLLLLIGGNEGDILDKVADEFVPAAGGRDANIALLMIGGPEWEAYLPRYVEPWERRGATKHHVIIPGDDGVLDIHTATSRLQEATGIFIAGGRTSTYHRLYASEPIRSVIRERYHEGVPVAGLSAGALISPDVCLLRPTPNAPDQRFEIVQGLGLVSGLVVEVHFTEGLGTLPSLLEGMSSTLTRRGLGIDASACAVLENGQLKRVLGRSVYEITMTDFGTRSYTMVEVS